MDVVSRARVRAEARARARSRRARSVLAVVVGLCALAGLVVVLVVAGSPANPGGPHADGALARGPVAGGPPATGPGAGPVVGPDGERATVVGVADPVTLDVRLPGREVVRVRALGIQPGASCYAEESLAFARRILGGSEVRLLPGPGGTVTDPFDRRLLQVVLDGNDYAVLAAEAGVAQTYREGAAEATMPPIRDAEARARDAGRGFWSVTCD